MREGLSNDWEKQVIKDYPELNICVSGTGSLYLMNLPFNAVKVRSIFDMLDIHSDLPDHHAMDPDKPVLVYTDGLYYITRPLWDESEWLPVIAKGCVYLLPEKQIKEKDEQKNEGSLHVDEQRDKKKKQTRI